MTRKGLLSVLAALSAAPAAKARTTEQALGTVVDVSFTETPFEGAMEHLAKKAGFNLVIDRAHVAEQALKRPVTFRVDGIPAGEAVKWLCRIAGAGYEVSERSLLVSSRYELLRRNVTLRVYDVHDLTMKIADFPGASIVPESEASYSGGGLMLVSEGLARDITPASIAEHIMSTVQPENWAAELGTSIAERGGRLVIAATREMHSEIEELLEHLRRRERRMVVFHVRAARLAAPPAVELRPGMTPDAALPADDLARMDAVLDAQPGRLLAGARFACFNGQRVQPWGGRQTSYLKDFEISGDDYDPVMDILLRGFRADVRPLVSDDGSSILVELRLGWSDPRKGELREFRPLGPEDDAEAERGLPTPGAVQQPRVGAVSLMTTVRLPTGRTVAVAASDPEDPSSGEEIVFLVKATAVAF